MFNLDRRPLLCVFGVGGEWMLGLTGDSWVSPVRKHRLGGWVLGGLKWGGGGRDCCRISTIMLT